MPITLLLFALNVVLATLRYLTAHFALHGRFVQIAVKMPMQGHGQGY